MIGYTCSSTRREARKNCFTVAKTWFNNLPALLPEKYCTLFISSMTKIFFVEKVAGDSTMKVEVNVLFKILRKYEYVVQDSQFHTS